MTKDQAEAETFKRNENKSKHQSNMEWYPYEKDDAPGIYGVRFKETPVAQRIRLESELERAHKGVRDAVNGTEIDKFWQAIVEVAVAEDKLEEMNAQNI